MSQWRTAMQRQTRIVVVGFGLLGFASAGLAQHQGHQMGAPSAGGASCQANAKEGLKIVESADRRLEEARQTNNPQQMRAAMNDLQSALGEVRTQLSLCVSPSAADKAGSGMGMGMEGMKGMEGMDGMDHSAMEGMQGMDHPSAATGTKHSKPSKAAGPGDSKQMDHSQKDMDHSKMSMPGMNAPPKEAAGTSPPSAGKHMSQAPQTNSKDPVCGMEVGTGATEKATYQGKTYYFCSRADREKFLSDPAAYVKR